MAKSKANENPKKDAPLTKDRLVPTRSKTWVFLAPVVSLQLTNDVHREFTVDRVTFIHGEKLPRVRRRFGIKKKLSQFDEYIKRYFAHNALAVLRTNASTKEMHRKCRQIVADEAAILSLSYLGYDKRKYGRAMGLPGARATEEHDDLFINTGDASASTFGRCSNARLPMRLDGGWKRFQRLYYFKLLKILKGQTPVDSGWRSTLRQAAILIGRSIGTVDIPTAFLWNMIALECLLTEQQDTVRKALPSRCEAFLGWVGFWKEQGFEGRIQIAYNRRCSLVHQGKIDGIDRQLLLFTDDLLFNVLLNIVNHPTIFKSKADVVMFSRKVEAEYLLGGTSKVRPKGFRALQWEYTRRDLEGI